MSNRKIGTINSGKYQGHTIKLIKMEGHLELLKSVSWMTKNQFTLHRNCMVPSPILIEDAGTVQHRTT